MSVKLQRYPANESQFNRGGRLRTEIQIPSSAGIVDLTSSKVVLDMHMEVKAGTTDVLLPCTFGNQEQVGGPQALIRNSSLVSNQSGTLTEKRNRNIIDANIEHYKKSRAQEDQLSLIGNSTNQNSGVDRMNLLPDNPFILYKKPNALTGAGAEVTESAVTHRTEVTVPWVAVDAFGQFSQFPFPAINDCQLKLEFEDQIATVAPARMPFSQGEPADNTSAVASLLGNAGAPLTLTKTTANYWRAPRQGDICTAYFLQTTTSAASFRYPGTADPGTSGGLACGLDEILSVAIAGGKYVVTLKNGFATTAATEACQGIVFFYCSASEMLGNGAFPIPFDVAMAGGTGDTYGSASAPIVFSKNTPGGIQTSKYDAAVTVDALSTIPWYVGAPVTFTVVGGGAANVISRTETTIASVKVNGDNVEIVLTDPFDATATGGAIRVQCSLTYRDSLAGTKFTANWVIDEVYAELFKINLLPSQMEKATKAMANMELPFVDAYLVQRSMPDSTTAHTEVLSTLPGTIGLAVLTPQNLTLLSGFDGCNRYRFSLDGKEVSNQDIVCGSADLRGRQLHNYFLKMFFANLQQPLKKYDAPKFDYNNTDDTATHAMYPLVIPNRPVESVVQVQLFSDTAMAGKSVFYVFYRQKVLQIKGGRAMVSA
jgi:hypothetical protein